MKTSEYWKRRMEELAARQYESGEAYHKNLQNQFRMAQNSVTLDIEHWYGRLAENNDISLAGARKLLKKNELEEFHWNVQEYIKRGRENAVSQQWMRQLENASAKYHISHLQSIRIQMQQHCELLSAQYDSGLTEFLGGAYQHNYYHTAFEIQKGTGIYTDFAAIDTRKMDIVLSRPWAADGTNFSERIWKNKEKLVRTLNTELTQHLIRGDDPQNAINAIAKAMNASRAQAGRLVMTELAAVNAKSRLESYRELGIGEYEIVATLDKDTSQICRQMDGRHFRLSEWEIGTTAPPFHPWCRTDTAPYFEDDFGEAGERAARDGNGKTYYVPADMTYQDWKKSFVDGDKSGLKETTADDKIVLDDTDKAVLLKYKSFESYIINDKLRNCNSISELSEESQQFIKQLDVALTKIPRYIGNLVRVVDFSDFPDKDKRLEKYINGFIVNEEIPIKEYWSTSKSDGYNQNPSVVIYIQDAEKGRDVSQVGLQEYEVLYERGTKFKVLAKTFKDDVWYILLREM